MWKARTVQWQNAGIPVKSTWPKEGAIAYVSGFVIPKNAPHLEGAYAYLNAMLEPEAQLNFAKDMGYNPTVTNADVPGDLNERIGFKPEEVDQLVQPGLRLHDRERRLDEGLVGQELQGLTAGTQASRRRRGAWPRSEQEPALAAAADEGPRGRTLFSAPAP